MGRRCPRAAVRPARAALTLRSVSRARGEAHGVGLLPRPLWIDRGHAAAHRGADRALCARLSRPDPGTCRGVAVGRRIAQRELRRRRHRIRRLRPVAILHAPDLAHVLDAGTRPLSLLCFDASRRRCSRHVRLFRGAARPGRRPLLATDMLSALSTDLYELTMIGGYYVAGMARRATLELFVRPLPPTRT